MLPALLQEALKPILLIKLVIITKKNEAIPPSKLKSRGQDLCCGPVVLLTPSYFNTSRNVREHAALAWLWENRESWRSRALLLTAGALLAAILDGWFDAVTWTFPFEPLLRNLSFNLLQHGADAFGTRAWWWYAYDYAGAWGGTLPVFMALAMIGARRLPLPFLMGIVICLVHSFIPHKETRFLLPAVTLFAICAGFGLVQLGLWLRNAIPARHGRSRDAIVYSALCGTWLILSGINVFGLDYAEYWDTDQHDALTVSNQLFHEPPSCGLGLYGLGTYTIGGYSYLHRRIPIYQVLPTITPAGLTDAARDFDTAVLDRRPPSPRSAALLTSLGYRNEKCTGIYCILRRPGSCRGSVMPKPDGPPHFYLGPARYPQRQGIND